MTMGFANRVVSCLSRLPINLSGSKVGVVVVVIPGEFPQSSFGNIVGGRGSPWRS